MGAFVPYLSSIVDAGQSFFGPGHGYTFHYVPFITLLLFSLPTVTTAFAPSYSAPTQCGPFSTTWNRTGVVDGPPSVLLILPFGAQSTIVEVPQYAYNPTTMTGNYTLDKLPLKSGTQFIVSMLYGDGSLFSRPIRFRMLTRSLLAHCTSSLNRSKRWRCFCDPNGRRLARFKLCSLQYSYFFAELVLHAQPTCPVSMLGPNSTLGFSIIPRTARHPRVHPGWQCLPFDSYSF